MSRYQYIFYLLFLTTAISCSSGMKFPKSQLEKLNANFSGTYLNKSVNTTNGINQYTLTNIFEIEEDSIEVITLRIIDSTRIELSTSIQNDKKTYEFRGNLTEEGHFEIYIRNNVDRGIKSFADIKTIKFTTSSRGTLLVDDYERNERKFLLWRVGGRSRIQSEFQLSQNSQ